MRVQLPPPAHMNVEVGFGSILIPTRAFEDGDQFVVTKRMGEHSLETMRRYTVSDGRTALSARTGTTGANKEYIKGVLQEKMTLDQMIESYRVYCEDEGMPVDQGIIDILTRDAQVDETVTVEI